jgi:hypothetical protein
MDEFLARLARSSEPMRQQDLTLGRGHAERAAALHMIEPPTDRADSDLFRAVQSCWAVLSNKVDKDNNRTPVGRNNMRRQRLHLRQLRLLQPRRSMRDDALCD